MKPEYKELLLRDLCARLSYGVILNVTLIDKYDEKVNRDIALSDGNISYIFRNSNWIDYKPYLRPMSSMTDEEKEYIQRCIDIVTDENYGDGYSPSAWDAMNDFTTYCDSRHLDHRGLIWRELALEAPEGMYKIESDKNKTSKL